MPENTLDQKTELAQIIEHSDIFMCPACRGEIRVEGDNIKCLKCFKYYQIKDGIPLLFLSDDNITDTIKSFYEKTPFPNYENAEDVKNLIQKSEKGIFARLLNEQIPFNIKVLEVGCGTGQLSNFLGIYHRYVFGTDICFSSLKLGQNFKIKNNLERVGFYQMNLFKPIFKKESFHLVICSGVLHHTGDPYLGFETLAKLVKKDGYIIIGLYNKYGRIITNIRQIIFRIFGNHFKFLDRRLKNKDIGEVKKAAWFLDQYKNLQESKHTIGEVLKWFDRNGFEFVNGIPKAEIFANFSEQEKLFEPNRRGNWLDHFLIQLRLIFAGGREGGFFLMIGKKKF